MVCMNVPTVVSFRSARPRPTCPLASESGSMKNCGERCCARDAHGQRATIDESASAAEESVETPAMPCPKVLLYG